MMKKNLLVGQSGGPTAAINATLAGVLSQAQISEQIDIVYGAFNGIEGVMQESFVNLTEKIPNTDAIHLLRQTPSAALGSCRDRKSTRLNSSHVSISYAVFCFKK